MQKRILLTASLAAILLVIGIGCNKLDTTSQGSDLVTVDNINTFSREFPVITTQGDFEFTDSTILRKTENHIIGNITTDAQFGKTETAIYLQLKPTFYPFYFGNAGDTVKFGTIGNASPNAGLDSVVLCLSYKGAWGDTSIASNITQTFEVRTINDADFRDKTDTIRKLSYQVPVAGIGGLVNDPTTTRINPQIIASKTVYGRGVFKDSVNNQIRIRLDPTFAASLFAQDTLTASSNNGFLNDSIFRSKFNGFQIKSTSSTGNTLYYVNITEAKTRLEFHFRKTKAGVKDTVMQAFQLYPNAVGNSKASSSANYVKRDYFGTNVKTPAPNDIYLQTAPGTFAYVKIPGLNSFKDTNRIIHRAYLVIDQNDGTAIPNIYTPPPYLYLDLKDTVANRFKPVYFDLSEQILYNPDATFTNPLYHPYPNGNVDLNNFGGVALRRFENGNTFYRYEFNLTRYVQHIVTNGYYNYDLRVYAPFTYYYNQYAGSQYVIPFFNQLALGRVRVGSGRVDASNTHRMKMVIIYSLPK